MVGNHVFGHWGPIIIVSERILVVRAAGNEDSKHYAFSQVWLKILQILVPQAPGAHLVLRSAFGRDFSKKCKTSDFFLSSP